MTVEPMLHARLLQAYSDASTGRGKALEATTLRSESVQKRQIFAHRAAHGTLGDEQLRGSILGGTISRYSLEPDGTARLARVVALQNQKPQDTDFAIAALRLVLPLLEIGEQHRYGRLLAELLMEQGKHDQVLDVLEQHPTLRRAYHGYLRVDATNPWVRGNTSPRAVERWLRGFNRPFTQSGLLPLTIQPGEGVPFNRLTADIPDAERVTDGPLITVIMTTFQPAQDDALQSARSILNQTWQNLELIIVDDASPETFQPVLDQLENLDPRVRVIRLNHNGGTYRARNIGIQHARGEYIAGQDADDYSHPQRIATQARQLEESPQVPGNQVYTINMTEDLVRTRRGYHPFIPSAPAVMYRTQVLRDVGGYLPARKAADNELLRRISTHAGTPVERIREPLIFMRILPDSLSRADFRPGWQHPARRAFWSAYKHWHQTADRHELQLTGGETSPVHIPPRFTNAPEPTDLDVVLVADWCEYGETQLAGINEIRALLDAGHRVGIMHLENAIHLAEHSRVLIPEVQQLINDGRIVRIIEDETHHAVHTMLVRSPELLQFMPHRTIGFSPQQVIAVAGTAPFQPGDTRPGYLAADTARHAETFFGARPQWLPGSEQIRALLQQELPADEILPGTAAPAFNPGAFQASRRRRRSTIPVVGRWAGTGPEDWPRSPHTIQQALPVDGTMDVRLYGDPTALLRALDAERLPSSWLCFTPTEISRRAYTRMLDFYIHHPQQQPHGRHELPLLEALAAGAVLVLPPSYEPIYGDAAVYAEPRRVNDVVNQLWNTPHQYAQQSARGVAYVQAWDPHAYLEQVQTLTRPAKEPAAP